MCHRRTRLIWMRATFRIWSCCLRRNTGVHSYLKEQIHAQPDGARRITHESRVHFLHRVMPACRSGVVVQVSQMAYLIEANLRRPLRLPASDFQKQHQQAEEQLRPGIEAEREKDQKEGS